MVFRSDSDSEFIEPDSSDTGVYTLFDSKNRNRSNLPFVCKTEDVGLSKQLAAKTSATSKTAASNKIFKTLRLALSCTGEYAVYHGGTVAKALAAMNATMTRVNGVFNKDLAVKLIIISNNTSIIYINAATDPYSSAATGANGAWNQELQTTLTNSIGSANYDIGHLFGATGGGGNAGCIGCVCVNPSSVSALGKGSAFTSPSDGNPKGDTFDINYVAHEMGHQLGANHTFTYTYEGSIVNVEPGSGSTIMGYSGITDYDVQPNSDDYFAYRSIDQIQSNLSTKTCPVSMSLTNNPPIINAGNDYIIPFGTAFKLTGTGSDLEGDGITYCWEENDTATATESGAQSLAYPTKSNGPLFRSFPPTTSPIRYMPAPTSVLLNDLSSSWESVSNKARSLHFTLTGRDNAALGTAQTMTDAMVVTVSGTIGSFAVTSQNIEDLSWTQGTNQTITWSVNGSNTLTGSANVNIKLSTDGGLTFPTTLASNIPNNGTATITVPAISAQQCRILIEPTANIYYAINSKNFAIGYSVTSSSCTTYTFPFTFPFAIPENASYSTKTITVPAVPAGTIITDVNVAIGITHALLRDVQIEMLSPQSSTVKLLDDQCGNANLVLNYDDLGAFIDCLSTTNQTVAPFNPLYAFNGQNPQGIWTFRIRDSYPVDTGTLNSASITICTQTYTLGTPKFEIVDFVLYPNTNNGKFKIKFSSHAGSGAKVLIHDVLGRKIFEKQLEVKTSYDEDIQMENAQAGIYLLTVIDGDRKEIRKIVIE